MERKWATSPCLFVFLSFYGLDPFELMPYGAFIMYMIMNQTSSSNKFPCYWYNFLFYMFVRNMTVDKGYSILLRDQHRFVLAAISYFKNIVVIIADQKF